MKNDLSAEDVRGLFDYNPLTGLLLWKVKRRRIRIGGIAGNQRADRYVRVKINGASYLAQRLAWLHYHGVWPTFEVDHKNRNRGDNSIGNLRDATPTQNRANSKISTRNTSGYKGVSFDKGRQKYRAELCVSGQTKFLGYFESPLLASLAHSAAEAAAHGEFVIDAARALRGLDRT